MKDDMPIQAPPGARRIYEDFFFLNRDCGLIVNEIVLVNNFYLDRFPKATQQMEEKINKFIQDNENLETLSWIMTTLPS